MFCKMPFIGLLCLLPGLGFAQPDWSLSGYASLAAGRMEDRKMEYQGYSADEWSFEGDSVLGLQLNLELAERLSLTAQVVGRGHNWDDTDPFDPELDWLFLRYQLNEDWRVRLGRMRTPFYLYSETIDVGYSYVWVRPPTDVYAPIVSPFSNFDGADATYISNWGDLSIDVQLLMGVTERSQDSLNIEVDPMAGGNITLQTDDLTLRYGLLMLNTDIHARDLQDLARIFQLAGTLIDPVFAEVPRQFSATENLYRYQSLGLRWNRADFTALGEAFEIHNTDDGYTNNARGWYLSLQYRFDRLTPYVVSGWHKNDFARKTLDALLESYSIWPEGQTIPPLQEQVDLLDQARAYATREIRSYSFEQYTWTFGLRYDVYPNVALKAEWQYFDFASGSSQIIVNTLDHPDHTSMTTFILDVVF